jgi:hypothetical protein
MTGIDEINQMDLLRYRKHDSLGIRFIHHLITDRYVNLTHG